MRSHFSQLETFSCYVGGAINRHSSFFLKKFISYKRNRNQPILFSNHCGVRGLP
ncbi:hypothetical protein WCP94_002259 [Bilophila wadsworthia]